MNISERRVSIVCYCDDAKPPKRIALVGLAFGYDAHTKIDEPYPVQLKGPAPRPRWTADEDRRSFPGVIDEEDVGAAVVENRVRYLYRCGRCGVNVPLLDEAWDGLFLRLLLETGLEVIELRSIAGRASRR